MSIIKSKYKRPKISFGFAQTTKTVANGTVVKVYLNGIFSIASSTPSIKPISGLTIVKTNQNVFTITPTSTGTYNIVLEVENENDGVITPSNKIILTVT